MEKNIEDINLIEYLTLEYLCIKVSNFIKNKKSRYQTLENLIENLTFENTRIVTTMNIEYIIKDIIKTHILNKKRTRYIREKKTYL